MSARISEPRRCRSRKQCCELLYNVIRANKRKRERRGADKREAGEMRRRLPLTPDVIGTPTAVISRRTIGLIARVVHESSPADRGLGLGAPVMSRAMLARLSVVRQENKAFISVPGQAFGKARYRRDQRHFYRDTNNILTRTGNGGMEATRDFLSTAEKCRLRRCLIARQANYGYFG